jgi:hypothetical protein
MADEPALEGFFKDGWGYPASCRLPHALWRELRHTFNYDPTTFKEYPSARAAYEALVALSGRKRQRAPGD